MKLVGISSRLRYRRPDQRPGRRGMGLSKQDGKTGKELLKNEDGLTEPRDSRKCTAICITEAPEGREREGGRNRV